MRGTVKAAVLEGDLDCTNLVALSVYDSKPVYYLSMVYSKLRWVEVKKDVCNVDSSKTEKLRPRVSILKYGRLNLFLKKKITVSVIFSLSFNVYVYVS